VRITFLVNYDAASALALRQLLPSLRDHKLSVFYTHKTQHETLPKALRQLTSFEQSLLDRETIFNSSSAKNMNHVNGVDLTRYQKSQPDLVISIRHMSILKSPAIALPRRGVINLHSGILPNYQGVMATFWAMKNREITIGSSLHFIEDVSIDTGSIIAKTTTPTHFNQSYLWNTLNIYRVGCEQVIRTVNSLAAGETLSSKPQLGYATYYSFPKADDIANFDAPLFRTTDNLAEFL